MIEDSSNRLLMSDSIRGMIPDLEEEYITTLGDAYVIITLTDLPSVTSGILVGISIESLAEIRLDMRVKLNEAYNTIKNYTTSGLSCRLLYMHLGNDEICLPGPYKISSPKILDIDPQNKMCTLGVDLIRI
jgi:hypothetical protein